MFNFGLTQTINSNTMEPKHFETYSIITKGERVTTINHGIANGTFVLEITSPLPGYYGAEYLINQDNPGHILLILKNFLPFETFYRTLRKIKKFSSMDFDAAPADVTIGNLNFPAIRLRDLDQYSDIQEIQEYFMDEKIQFAKPMKVNDLAMIRVKKFLSLTEISEGIYNDDNQRDYKYFTIDNPVTWKAFEKITSRIRHNINDKNFDGALGVLFRTGDMIDVIRIYSNKMNLDDLKEIKRMYIKALSEL